MENSITAKINATGGLTLGEKSLLKYMKSHMPYIAYASADHTVNTTTTLANDSELFFDVKVGRKYQVDGVLFTTTDATDGIKVALATAVDATAARLLWSYEVDNAANQTEAQTDLTSPSPTGVAASLTAIRLNGFIDAGADGRITLQSALVADNNAATTILKGSYLRVFEIE